MTAAAGTTPAIPGRVGVVVVNYLSHAMVEANLAELAAGLREVEFVVVDSFASVAEQTALRAVTERHAWELVALGHNPGFGGAANAGAERALELGCDVIVFLNPDARIDASGLSTLARAAASRPTDLFAPRILRPDGSVWFDGASFDRKSGLPGRRPRPEDAVPWLTGACLATAAALWRRLGGFDHDYFMYYEDVDLSVRCAAAGGAVAVVADVTVVHAVGATQGSGKSPLYVRYCCRNRLLLASKQLNRSELLRWILHTPRSSWLITRRAARRRELPRRPDLLAAMVTGTASGLWHALPRLVRPA